MAYGAVQLRFSEAFTLLPLLTPAAIPGLAIGCFLGNLSSPFGLIDVLIGTAATLLAALLVRLSRKLTFKGARLLSAFIPPLVNAALIGLEVTWFLPEGLSFRGFLVSAASVGAGELIVCLILGLPLLWLLQKLPLDRIRARQ